LTTLPRSFENDPDLFNEFWQADKWGMPIALWRSLTSTRDFADWMAFYDVLHDKEEDARSK
jgi:hypothetical protein